MKKPLKLSLIYALSLFIILVIFSLDSTKGNWPLFWAKLIWSSVVSYFCLCIYRSGQIYRYRSILFILIAFFFFIEFKLFRFLSLPTIQPPYCHIAQSSILFNFIHNQILAFTSGNYIIWGVLTLGFLWLLILFTIGQGICSWVCFYGGIDEAFSRIRRKPLLKLRISKKWRDFPLAFLVFILIVSFLQGQAVFCSWFCPLKITTSFWDSEAIVRNIQIIFFIIALLIFLILLPIFTKKRTFCSLICPFGALASILGKFNPYRVVIDREKCTLCKKCVDVCPVFAIDPDDLNKKYKISSYCNKCGACIDACPAKAITISAFDKISCINRWGVNIKDIFIFLALLLTGAISSIFVPEAILQLLGLAR